MSFANVSLVIEILVVVLLSAVIYFTLRLNKHFQMLQKNRAELARQLSGFAHSTERAEAAIQMVRRNTTESAQQMEELLKKAEMLKQDLGYLVDRGNGLADRLEGGIRGGRDPETEGSSRRNRRSGAVAATAEVTPATSSRRARRSSKEDLEPSLSQEHSRAATAQEPTESASRRRRRSSGDSENTSAGSKPSSQSNRELLKVLQGM